MGILSAGGFFAIGVLALFREKIKVRFLISAFVLGAGAISIAGVSIMDIFSYIKNPYSETVQKEVKIPFEDKNQSLKITFKSLNNYLRVLGAAMELNHVSNVYNFFPTDENQIRVVFKYKIFAKDKRDQKLIQVKNNLNTPSVNLSGDILDVLFLGDQMFSQITPILPITVSVDFYIPRNVKFTFYSEPGYYHSNLKKPDWMDNYSYLPCTALITYQATTNSFYCDEKISSKYKKNIIEDKIKEQLDKIAPFIGKDQEYSFMDEEDNQYWRFHSMRRLDDDYLLVKLSDQFFNLFVKVKVDLDKKGNLTFDHVQLQDLEQKGLMNAQRIKAYDKLDQLSGFNLDMQDEEQELLSKIAELEKKLDHLRNEE